MFKSMKRIIRWAGKYKGRLYLGSVCSFFSSLSTAIPTMAAAFALDKVIQAYWTNTAIDTVLIWQMLGIIIGSIVLNFLLSYLRAVLQEMLKDAPIVILDEATASIDPENEHLIQEAISALTHGKTIITIAHRLATIENADQILVIDGGTVAQRGTHKELLQQEGTYKKFIQIREQAEGWRIQ